MKYFVVVALSFILASFVSAQPARAQVSMCNQKCDLDSDCGSGYSCYVGVCRLNACPSSSTCVCTVGGTSATPTPRTLIYTTPAPTIKPFASASAVVKKATTTARLKTTPETGFDTWTLAGLALACFGVGVVLNRLEKR